MNYRNAIYTTDGRIDCEIEHAQYGWIPTTLSPDDPPTAELFATVEANGDAKAAVVVSEAELKQAALEEWRESTVVSPLQAEQALDDFGYIEKVDALLADPSTPKKTKRAWEKAQEIRRMSPTVLEMLAVLEVTPEEADELFKHAKTLEF